MRSLPTAASILPRGRTDGRLAVLAAAFLVLNVGIGAAVGTGAGPIGLAVAVLPVAFAATVWIGVSHAGLLPLAAFAIPLSGLAIGGRLPGAGSVAIYSTDLLVAVGVAGWIVAWLITPRGSRRPIPRTPVLSWPFVLFALAIGVGVVRGHATWGTSYLSQPSRLLLYAAVALAVADLTPARAYRGLVVVFYLGTLVETGLALYFLATGKSQTAAAHLSTGGHRVLALSTAMYEAGALMLALLSLDLDRGERRRVTLHLAIAALATLDLVLALGRTTFVAAGALVPVLLFALRRTRRTLLGFFPLLLPVLVLVVVLTLQLYPSLGSTLGDRLTGNVSNDTAVVERQRQYDAELHDFDKHVAFGFGFGRPISWVSVGGTVQTATGVENSYIWILAGGGAVALAAFVGLILAFFGDAFQRLRGAVAEERTLVLFAMSMAFILLVNTLTGPILTDPTLMLTLWVAFLLPMIVPKRRSAR